MSSRNEKKAGYRTTVASTVLLLSGILGMTELFPTTVVFPTRGTRAGLVF